MAKYRKNLARRFSEEQQARIETISLDRERLEGTSAVEFMSLFVTGH
jgi:hypothetical protein